MHPDLRGEALLRETAAAMEAGDDAAAERAAQALVRVNPREHAAWHALALIALRAGRAELALELAERARNLDRKNAVYLNTLAVAYEDLGRTAEAITAFRRVLKLRPTFADAHYNLGRVHERHERLPDARACYRRALAIDPRYSAAKHNLARILRRLGAVEEALALAREVWAEKTDEVDRMLGVGFALADAHGPREGAAFLAECLARRPEAANLHGERAGMLFALGEWVEAWQEYLWRPGANRALDAFPAPLPPDLGGTVVSLIADQGLGDTLFFLRFAGAIRARGGKAVVVRPVKLASLLADHPDLDGIADDDATPAPVGPRVLLGDLPYVLGTNAVAPPFPLRARPELVREWRDTLGALGEPPYVGLTWRAGTDLRATSAFVDRQPALFKEIALDPLARVAKSVVGTLVSVQRYPAAGETARLAALCGRPVHDLAAANDDLERMTALLAVLDEYIGVSNTSMHLRAGIGRTARVLVPYPAEWRWAAPDDRSPWFSGFGVYRQGADGGWEHALARLAADLRGA